MSGTNSVGRSGGNESVGRSGRSQGSERKESDRRGSKDKESPSAFGSLLNQLESQGRQRAPLRGLQQRSGRSVGSPAQKGFGPLDEADAQSLVAEGGAAGVGAVGPAVQRLGGGTSTASGSADLSAQVEAVAAKIVSSAEVFQQGSSKEIVLTLNTGDLGVEGAVLRKGAEGLDIRLLTSDGKARNVVLGNLDQLTESLSRRGVSPASLVVEAAGRSAFAPGSQNLAIPWL